MNSIKDKVLDISHNYYKYLLSLENVNAIGLGYKKINGIQTKELCIHVLVDNKVDEDFLTKDNVVPKMYMGIKTDVIKTGKVRPCGKFAIEDNIRPLEGGLPISTDYFNGVGIDVGTLGCIVSKVIDGEREFFILSNNHVIAGSNETPIGTVIMQPPEFLGGTLKDNTIASLYDFVQLKYMEKNNKPINYVDCAIGKILDKSIISGFIYGGDVINGVAKAILDENIKKTGFNSGLTRGKVTTIGATTETEFKKDKVAHFEDQILGELSNSVGDSGSVVINDEDKIIGLLYAGSDDDKFAYINDINIVLDKLNVEIYVE